MATGEPGRRHAPVCQYCGYDIGDTAYYVCGQWVCEECFWEWVNERYRTRGEELAEFLGVDTVYLC